MPFWISTRGTSHSECIEYVGGTFSKVYIAQWETRNLRKTKCTSAHSVILAWYCWPWKDQSCIIISQELSHSVCDVITVYLLGAGQYWLLYGWRTGLCLKSRVSIGSHNTKPLFAWSHTCRGGWRAFQMVVVTVSVVSVCLFSTWSSTYLFSLWNYTLNSAIPPDLKYSLIRIVFDVLVNQVMNGCLCSQWNLNFDYVKVSIEQLGGQKNADHQISHWAIFNQCDVV